MTRNLFNLITAWTSVVLLFAVIVIWILRILVQKKIVSKDSFFYKANRILRKYHKYFGIAFLAVAFTHGVLSSAEIFSINWGSLSFFFIAVMSLLYIIKQKVQRRTWVNMHRVLTLAVVLTFIFHLFDVGVYGLKLLQTPAATLDLSEGEIDYLQEIAESDMSLSTGETIITYQDGVYTGVADGFGPDLTVEVTIENNLITDIVVVSHNEVSARFYERPIAEIPAAIVAAQSVAVDSVSGATYTSIGIKNAVIDALSQAIVTGELPEEEILLESEHTGDGGRYGHGGGH